MKCQPSIFDVHYYINSLSADGDKVATDTEMHLEEHPSVKVIKHICDEGMCNVLFYGRLSFSSSVSLSQVAISCDIVASSDT